MRFEQRDNLAVVNASLFATKFIKQLRKKILYGIVNINSMKERNDHSCSKQLAQLGI